MQSDRKGKVIMKLEGVMAEAIIKIDPKKHKKFVTMENGKQVVCVILTKALYDTLQAALLFWQNLSTELKKWGFETNPYDFCIANKTIEGKQCTVAWHADDTKTSHKDDKVVTSVTELIEERFGKMTVTRGKKHVFLGMDVKFCEDGPATIKMKDCIKESIAEFGQSIVQTAATPTRKDLFDINEESGELTSTAR